MTEFKVNQNQEPGSKKEQLQLPDKEAQAKRKGGQGMPQDRALSENIDVAKPAWRSEIHAPGSEL